MLLSLNILKSVRSSNRNSAKKVLFLKRCCSLLKFGFPCARGAIIQPRLSFRCQNWVMKTDTWKEECGHQKVFWQNFPSLRKIVQRLLYFSLICYLTESQRQKNGTQISILFPELVNLNHIFWNAYTDAMLIKQIGMDDVT